MAVVVKPTGGTAPKPAPPPKLTLSQRAAKDPALLARALKDPGLRSKLDASLVPLAQQRQRALNTRLNAPVTPGSSMTTRDLAHAAKSAVDVQYGPADRQASTLVKQVPDFYANYLASLRAHAANTAAISDAAVTQDQQLQQGVRGVDQASSQQMQQAASQDAANRGTTAGDTTATANQASQVRQAMIGAAGSVQAGRGAAAKTYADTVANVVGPGQQLGAQTAAGAKLLGIRGQEGAADQQYRQDTIASEAKNVLAQQIAGSNQQAKVASIGVAKGRLKLTAQKNQTDAQLAHDRLVAQQNSPSAQKTAQQVAYFDKHGYYPASGGPKAGKNKAVKPVSGPGSLPSAAESKVIAKIHQVAGVINGGVGAHVKNKDGSTTVITHDLLRKTLAAGANRQLGPVDPRIVGIAFDVAAGKPLSPHSVQLAHDLGIHVGKHFKVAPKVSVKAPKPAAGAAPAITNPLGPIG